MESTVENKGKGLKLPKPNNLINIPYSYDDIEFYKWWCMFLKPFVPLTNRESDVMASFLRQRWLLSKNISDPSILDSVLMSENVKKKVIDECGITQPHFYVIMSNLRNNGVIENDVINPRLIPNQRQDDNGYFQLLILFGNKNKHDKI